MPRAGMLKISGDQVFATLQGEGITAGQPAVFLRLQFCNLACSWCDTGYTWNKKREEFWQEPVDWTPEETAVNIQSAWDQIFAEQKPDARKRLVITGGEPMLQRKSIVDLLKIIPTWQTEIETNGTVAPLPEMADCQINCSPKLGNSDNSASRRFRPDVLTTINGMPNSWFKFVVTRREDLDEVEKIVDTCSLDTQRIMIMPEGTTVEATNAHLLEVQDAVGERGWKITKRNQLEWFGNKRRT
jgi:organic radical activating enzyme